jgi:hypothetical protein
MSRVRHDVRLALWLLVVILSAGSTARGEETLRWKLKKGQTLTYQRTLEGKHVSEVVVGQPETQANTDILEMSFHVKDVDNSGVADIERTITRRIYKTKTARLAQHFDSKTNEYVGPNPKMAASLSEDVGKPYEIKMSDRGEILQDDTIPGRTEKGAPTRPADGQSTDVINSASILRGIPIRFPLEPVEKGMSWTINVKLGGQRDVIAGRAFMTTYTYEGVHDGVARIAFVNKDVLDAQSKHPHPIGTTSGFIDFDVSAGIPRDVQTKTTTNLKRQRADGIVVTSTG